MLRKVLKIVGVLVVLLLVVAAAGYAYVSMTWDRDYSSTPLPAIAASTDPAVIARGEYVVHAIAHCSACHLLASEPKGASIDWDKGMAGGYTWEVPLFGTFVAANITPDVETGIGGMSDGELARAIRYKVDRQGRILPFMWFGVGQMSDEDLTAVVSYLRSRPAVRHVNGPESWGFMAKAISGGLVPPVGPPPASVPPGTGPSLARGRYLAEGPAACGTCHTPRDPLTLAVNGAPFSGNDQPEPDGANTGFEFVTPNLTPDPDTGHVTGWDEDTFLRRLHGGRVHAGSPMPWENYQRMTEDDVRSIYRYLRSLPPAKHLIGPPHRKAGDAPSGS
jgi:mono/diheme cytochrome c family protein